MVNTHAKKGIKEALNLAKRKDNLQENYTKIYKNKGFLQVKSVFCKYIFYFELLSKFCKSAKVKLKSFIKWVSVWIFVYAIVFFAGCARIEYKEVLVPTKCDIKVREKPKKEASSTLFLRDLLIYTEGLERDIAFCRGESLQK